MNRYRVEFLSAALTDVVEIFNYITDEFNNRPAAVRIINQIFAKCDDLQFFPKRSAVKMEISGIKFRTVRCGKRTIVYTVNDDNKTVEVYAVKYSRMNIEKKLKKYHHKN